MYRPLHTSARPPGGPSGASLWMRLASFTSWEIVISSLGEGGAETISPKGSRFPAVVATTEGSATAGMAATDSSGDSWGAAGRIIFFVGALNPRVPSGCSTG
jgi:hypothetical protein